MIFVGFGLLAGGAFLFFRQRARKNEWLEAVGVITELEKSRQSGSYIRTKTADGWKTEPKYLYRPRIRFKPQTGRAVNFSANIWQSPAPPVGTEIRVLYNPQNPKEALINDFWHLWFAVLMLVFFGFFSIGMGLIALLFRFF